jgi:hypothetical protein
MDAPSTTTQQPREALLNSGLIDWLSLSDVDSRAAKLCRELPRPQRQEIALDRTGDSPHSLSRSTKAPKQRWRTSVVGRSHRS